MPTSTKPEFNCQYCGQTYAWGSDFVGKQVKCKQCSHVILVPNQPSDGVPEPQPTTAMEKQTQIAPNQEADADDLTYLDLEHEQNLTQTGDEINTTTQFENPYSRITDGDDNDEDDDDPTNQIKFTKGLPFWIGFVVGSIAYRSGRGDDWSRTTHLWCAVLAGVFFHIGWKSLPFLIRRAKNAISISLATNARPMLKAIKSNDLEGLRQALQGGADPDLKIQNITMLGRACARGHLELVKVLLDHGADPSVRMMNNWNVYHTAANNGHLEVLKYLHESGIPGIDATGVEEGKPIDVALVREHKEAYRWLSEITGEEGKDSSAI